MNRNQVAVLAVGLLVLVGGAVAATTYTDTSGSVLLKQTPDGPTVNVTGDTDLNLEDPFRTADTVHVETASDGNMTLSATDNAKADVDRTEITGPWTNVTNINTTAANLTIDPEDKSAVTVGGGIEQINISDTVAVNDGAVDFAYDASSSATVTVTGLPANVDVAAYDAAAGSYVDTTTANGSGIATFDVSGATRNIRIVESRKTDLTEPEPIGGQNESSVSTVSVQVNDSDFNRGSSVTVDFEVDGSSVGSDTLTSNGTASTSVSVNSGGDHTFSAEATDTYGHTTTESYGFQIPQNLTIFEERDPGTQISTATVQIQFFTESGVRVFNRSTSNGKLRLTDLPVAEEMTITAEANGYIDRRIYIESIYEQQELYLLNDTVTTDQIVFRLNDLTGRFNRDSAVLRVQRPLTKDFNGDGNKTTEYKTIAGDRFGPSGEFVTNLETGERYRLVIENQDGDRRILGEYQTDGDAVEVLEIGQLEFSGDVDEGAVYDATLVGEGDNRLIRVVYNDSEEQTTELRLNVTNQDTGNVLHTSTDTNTFGNYSNTIQVPDSAPENVTYNVSLEADRGGETLTFSTFVGDLGPIANLTGVGSDILFWISWVGIIGLMGFVVIYDDALAALVGWAAASAATVLGAISIPGAALAVAGAIALLYNVARRRGA